MKKLVGFILTLLLWIGCKDKDGFPSGVLKPHTMQLVFWDLIRADVYTAQFIKKDVLKKDTLENARLQQQVFAHHEVTKEAFYASYQYYLDHGNLMRALLDSLSAQGEKERYQRENQPLAVPARPARLSLFPLPPVKPRILIPMPIPGEKLPAYE